jgi:hypothetical protein
MPSLTTIIKERENKKLKEYNEFCVIIPDFMSVIRIGCKNKESQWAYYRIPHGANIFCFCHGHTRKEILIYTTNFEMPVFIRSGKNAIVYMLEANKPSKNLTTLERERRIRNERQ